MNREIKLPFGIGGRKKKEAIKHNLVLLVLCTLALVTILLGSSYAYFNSITEQGNQNKVNVGTLEIAYDDTSSGYGDVINLVSAFPISDEEGMDSTGYRFKLTNSGTLPTDYRVQILNDTSMIEADGCEGRTLPLQNIKYSVNGGVVVVLGSLESKDYVISSGTLQPGETEDYVIRMWIDEKSGNEILGAHYHGKVVIEGTQEGNAQYTDKSGANAPVVLQGQIPVTYSKEKSSWVKADTTKKWYDYNSQEWANVVTVKETGTKTREEYMNAEAGTEVSMDDINTMWVWIPRYEYMYTNLGTTYAGGTKEQPGEIKVNFLSGKSTTPSDSTNYKVHPAFTFGDTELGGLWYAKFETSTTDATCNSNVTEANCNKLMTSLQVKPNVSSWRYVNVSNFFNSARNMQLLYASTYGFSKTDSDIHISKNSEWGAIAYLSQSKYGKYGNPDYEGANKEIYQNKSSSYMTGSSNGTPSTDTTNTQVSYDVEKSGTGASTTGNITGVYDMSGGSYEYVMGNLNKTTDGSGFSTFPEDKYYGLYISTTPTTACNNGICFGHALSETASWYSDNASFVSATNPWFDRGGGYNSSTNAGVFFSNGSGHGGASNYYSSRLVHVPI